MIGLSIVLSYVALITIPYLWMAVPAALPFLALKSWKNVFVGFGIGMLSSMSIYLFYPLALVSRLSSIIGSIAGEPPILVLIIYPLIYGTIFALSALLWSGINYEAVKGVTSTK